MGAARLATARSGRGARRRAGRPGQRARAVDGQATEAALVAVAAVFGVRRRAVTLVAGATSRTKILEVEGADPATLTSLLAGDGPGGT